jgi:NADH:quinone reductase (non-electrogenic)
VNLRTSKTVVFPGHLGSGNLFREQCLKGIRKEGIPVAALPGSKPEKHVRKLKEPCIRVMNCAMPVNVAPAKKAEQAEVDALVAVGFDGGGRTGLDRIPTFIRMTTVSIL